MTHPTDASPNALPNASPKRRRWIRNLAIAAGLVALYALLGFVVAPRILHRKLQTEAAKALNREVRIESVQVNPFTLSVSIQGLLVNDRDGAPLAGFERLVVRLAPLAALDRELGLREIRLVKPTVRVALGTDGKPSFQDLLDRPPESAPPAPPAKPEEAGKPGWGLYVGLLAPIEDASLTFVDGTRAPAFTKELGPLSIRLKRFHTRPGVHSPYSFRGSTDTGESFAWEGQLTASPPGLSGTVSLERLRLDRYRPYTREQAPAEIRSGLATLRAAFEGEWGKERQVLRIADASLTVEGLRVGRPGVVEDDLTLPSIAVSGVQVDLLARRASVAEVALRGGTVRALRDAAGRLNLAQLAAAPTSEPAPSGAEAGTQPVQPVAPQKTPPDKEQSKPFAWSVGRVGVEGFSGIEWGDRMPARPVSLALDDISLLVKELRGDPGSRWPLTLSFAWSGGGKASIQGTLSPWEQQGEARVEVESLGLAPVAPYLDGPQRLVDGKLSVKGGAQLGMKATVGAKAPAGMPVAFQGDVRLDGLVAETAATREELLRLRSLELQGIDFSVPPMRTRLRSIRLLEPKLRVVKAAPDKDVPAEASAATTKQPEPKPPEPMPQVAVGSFRLERGRVSFADRSMTPPVVLDVTDIDVRLTNLSSRETERSTVEARMQLLGAAPLTISGTVNPLQTGAYTDMVVRSKSIDLTPLGPYFARYAGYALAKGKLDLDLHVKIEDRALRGENVARVDQLTLGDKVDSPDATALPVKLGLAILRDRDGVILLDLPVEGKLDDPEFRIGRVVLRVLVNVFTKVATSPFSALAALVGGGDQDLSVVDLPPGEVEPGEEGSKRLAALAKALSDRPGLGLEVEASVDESADRAALQRRAWEEKRRAVNDKTKPITPEEEAAQIAAEPVAPEALRALAADRAERARGAILAAGVDPARLFLVDGGERARKEKGARVYFTLR